MYALANSEKENLTNEIKYCVSKSYDMIKKENIKLFVIIGSLALHVVSSGRISSGVNYLYLKNDAKRDITFG